MKLDHIKFPNILADHEEFKNHFSHRQNVKLKIHSSNCKINDKFYKFYLSWPERGRNNREATKQLNEIELL